MGDTVIKDADKLSPYQVRGLVDNAEGSKGLFNHYKIKGIDVGKRIDRRERRREQAKLSTTPKSTNIQKTSSLVNNNEKIMDKQVKQAAFVKLATIKLAINYVIRNRLMSKQAAMGNILTGVAPFVQQGFNQLKKPVGNAINGFRQNFQNGINNTVMRGRVPLQNTVPVVNSQSVEPNLFAEAKQYQAMPSSPSVPAENLKSLPVIGTVGYNNKLRERIGLQRPGVSWNKNTQSYDLSGIDPSVARSMMEGERARIEDAFAQLTPAEQEYYRSARDAHIQAIDNWERGQNQKANPQSGLDYNPRDYNQDEADYLLADSYNNVAPINNPLDLQDDTQQAPLFANGSNYTLEDVLNGYSPVPLFANGSNLDLEDVLNGKSPESTAPQNAVATNPYMRSQRTMFD